MGRRACCVFWRSGSSPGGFLEGGDIRIGDILLVRSGFVERYYELSSEQRYAAATRVECLRCGCRHLRTLDVDSGLVRLRMLVTLIA
jgi:hypothetical protein